MSDEKMDEIVKFEVGQTGGMDEKGRMVLEPVIVCQFGDHKFRQLYPVEQNGKMIWRWLTIATPSEQDAMDKAQKEKEDKEKEKTSG